MSLGSGALPATGHHSAMLTVLLWVREWRVTQEPPERPNIFTTSDLPKQSSKCPVGSHFRELIPSCKLERGNERSIRGNGVGNVLTVNWQLVTTLANKPGRLREPQAARSHTPQLWPKGSFHWGSPLQKACPRCARPHTGELREIRAQDQSL